YFGGVFRVVIPDNLTPVVIKPDPLAPRFNLAFLDYAQARGFAIDPARVRRPTDKPRVENAVRYVRGAGFKGENFVSLEQAREWMITGPATRPATGSTAPPGGVPRSTSSSKSATSCYRLPSPATTSPFTPTPRLVAITTSLWPRRSTRCP